ncbi:MAG: MASE3 domain-containing protein [Chloroflexota bacterium]
MGALVFLGLYLTSRYSYLLFHSTAELFSIVVAFSAFIIAWNSRRFLDNNYLLFMGIAYLFIGGLDLVHTLAYRGMGVFQGYGSNLATQLWIGSRYVESLSFLIAPFLFGRRLRPGFVFLSYGVAISLLLASIFYWKVFPVCFVEGTGLTPFKIASEYLISLILLASIFLLFQRRRAFDRGVLRLLVASMVVTIAAEMAFTLYTDPHGLFNLLGHYLKIVSFYLVYVAIIETGFKRPYALLFRNLKQSEESLARQAAELAAVNKELEAFSYSVSHDLRAPLRGIDGFSQALLEDYAGKLDAQGKDYLQRVRAACQRMAQLIDDLLSLSRVARAETRYEVVSLSGLAQTIATELRKAQPERQVEFIIAGGLVASGDVRLLRITLEKLLENAWKFTAKHPSARIEFGAVQREGKTVYFVRDNGVGFDMAFADKLFSPFQRLHAETEFPGTGIGLAMAERIVHRHGGRVWAEGEVERGATFYFTLGRT